MAKAHKTPTPKIGDLRVWHIPQVPGKPFHVTVSSPDEAKKILSTLWNYDIFQFENKIKPDYSNASGLEVYEEDAGDGVNGWCEWFNEEGDDISDLMRVQEAWER